MAVCVTALYAAGSLSGRRAPGFALPDLHLKTHDLADYRGKVVLLDLMKTDCPGCQKLSQTLEKIKAAYGDKVAVLSVVNPPDNQTSVRAYVSMHKVTGPVLFDCGQMAASYVMATPQKPSVNLPHLFVIDQQGFIRNDFGQDDIVTGNFLDGKRLMKEIDGLLAPAAPASKKK